MDSIITLLTAIYHNLNDISVSGREDLNKLLAALQGIDNIVSALKEANQKEANQKGDETNAAGRSEN